MKIKLTQEQNGKERKDRKVKGNKRKRREETKEREIMNWKEEEGE